MDEDWPVEYLLANIGNGGGIGGGSGYPSRDGFEVYAFSPENVRCTYDNTDGFGIKISDTGSEDWHIQLKKNGVKVENGKWYQVTFDAKSSIDRSIIFSMQRDGSKDEDWRSYSGNKTVQLGNEWKPYTIYFRMTDATDENAIYNFSMGTVGGNRIRQQHTVNIKNMQLVELEDTWLDQLSQEGNLIKNPKFEYGDIAWEASIVEPGAGNVKFENGKAVFDISNVGTTDWHVQLKQNSIQLERGCNYLLTFKASSTVSRKINIGFMDNSFVHWYGGGLEAVYSGVERTVAVEFYMDKATNKDACMFISMGKVDANTPASVITLSDFRLMKIPGRPDSSSSSSSSGDGGWSAPIVNFGDGWEVSYWFGKVGQCNKSSGTYHIEILDTGSLDWHVQMQKKGIVLEKGKRYRMSFDAMSSVGRKIVCALQKDGTDDDIWTSYSGGSGQYELSNSWQTFTHEFTMTSETDRNVIYNISLGAVDGRISNAHDVYLRNIILEEIPDKPIESGQVGDEMLTADKLGTNNSLSGNSITEENGKFTANITNLGENDYDVQILWKDLTLEKGCTYEFKCNADFDNGQRIIKVGVMQDGTYKWYGGADLTIDGTSKEYTFTFVAEETISDGMLAISMGQIKDDDGNLIETPKGTVHLSDISLKKTKEAEEPDEPENPDDPDDPTKPIEGNILPELADGKGWSLNLNGDGVTPGVATLAYTDDGTVVINIDDVGSASHSVQFAIELANDLKLEEGAKYKVYCSVESTVARPISIMVQKKGDDWGPYNGVYDEPLSANTKTPFTFTFTKSDNLDAVFAVNMGQANSGNTPTGKINLSNIAIVKIESAPTTPIEGNLLPALKDGNGWGINGATVAYTDDETAVISIDSVGSEPHSVQFTKDLELEEGAEYTVSCDVMSDVARPITIVVQRKGGSWAPYDGKYDEPLSANTKQTLTFTFTKGDNIDAMFAVNMGKANSGDTPTGTITLSNISIVKTKDAPKPDDPTPPIDGNLLPALEDDQGWSLYDPNNATFSFKDGTVVINISSVGSAAHEVQFSHDLELQEGAEYEVSCDVKSSVDRPINMCVQDSNYDIYDAANAIWHRQLSAGNNETLKFTFKKNNSLDAKFVVNMGKDDSVDSTPIGTITLSNISIVKKSDASTYAESSDEEIDTLSEAEIETFSLKSVAAEEETVEKATDEEPETVEEIQEDADEDPETDEAIQEDTDEDPETDEVIQDTTDEEPEADEEIQEDASNDSVTPETVDTSLNEESNGSDDSN